ncbi:MAG: dehypoxanthine futalosine cyclase [Peptococcaceae bacterium]|jgi:cyclic dehypoxanthinyl futalosine synthase|nr:dehypoxanthine futalosine cyclase [Peptococcaceae bacterium]
MTHIDTLLAGAAAGERLTPDEGVALLAEAGLLQLGRAAHAARMRLHPEKAVTYVVDRNINYTNVCKVRCRFCAFCRPENHPEAYVLATDELLAKVRETVAAGGTELLIQGGLHPGLGLDFYLDMLRAVKERWNIHIHSFSPPEIAHLADLAGVSDREVLAALKDAGLDSLPGGGAEILVDRVRDLVSPGKTGTGRWLSVMRDAHALGMKGTATMMFGHLETPAERVEHMLRIRELQDATGGFTAFIPWTFQPGHTVLGGTGATAHEYLRTLALARLFLDNVPNLQVSWVTQGARVAQVALFFGANDFGSTMLEENVVRSAGVTYRMSMGEIHRVIEAAGFVWAKRDTGYRILEREEG